MKTKLILSTTKNETVLWVNLPFIPQVNEWLNLHDTLSRQEDKGIKLFSEGFPWIWCLVKSIGYSLSKSGLYTEVNALCDDYLTYCENILIEVYSKPNSIALNAVWLPGNSGLSEIEYVACWSTIFYNVKVLKPIHLLIDASDLEYRMVHPIQPVFNNISSLLKPQNIAIVNSFHFLGVKTVENLLKNCPHKGHSIFSCREDGLNWFESFSSNISNHR